MDRQDRCLGMMVGFPQRNMALFLRYTPPTTSSHAHTPHPTHTPPPHTPPLPPLHHRPYPHLHTPHLPACFATCHTPPACGVQAATSLPLVWFYLPTYPGMAALPWVLTTTNTCWMGLPFFFPSPAPHPPTPFPYTLTCTYLPAPTHPIPTPVQPYHLPSPPFSCPHTYTHLPHSERQSIV